MIDSSLSINISLCSSAEHLILVPLIIKLTPFELINTQLKGTYTHIDKYSKKNAEYLIDF